MSDFIIVLTIVLGILQSILSIIFVVRKKNKIAIASEIITSFALLCVLYTIPIYAEPVLLHAFAISLLEYCSVKIFLVLFFIFARKYAFYAIKKAVHKKKKNKKTKKLRFVKQLNNVKYWPKLKLGHPGMANRTYTKTRVKFDSKGFPIFKSYYTIKLRRKYYHRSRERHFYMANRTLYKEVSRRMNRKFTSAEMYDFSHGVTPKRYTWHHHQDRGVLELVDTKIHSETPHIGGYSIWGE